MTAAGTPGGAGRGVVLDIEGTTTPMSFVYDALFPYARAHLRRYLRANASSAEVREATRLLEREHAEDLARAESAPPWQDDSSDALVDRLAEYLEWLMDRDRKSPGLKLIQGHIWKAGYDDGTLRGQVYPDVKPALERWRSAGRVIAIYSSGSVLGQQLLFSHSTAGDLSGYINHYFDTGVGPKRAAESYRHIAGAIGLPAHELLFVSDVSEELDAARASGWQTVLCVRESTTKPANAGRVIHSFDEITP